MIVEQSDSFGFTVVCDDIRKEDNGKSIFIGVYEEMLINDNFPLTLPSLCFYYDYRERVEEYIDPVVLKIFMPGGRDDNHYAHEILNNEGRLDAVDVTGFNDRPAEEMGGNFISVSGVVRLNGVTISQEGEIRIRAYRGDDVVMMGAIPVRKANYLEG